MKGCAAFQDGLAPHILLHAVRRWYPRTTAFRSSRENRRSPFPFRAGRPALMAYLKASFHSGVMYARRLSTTCGVCRAASKFWNPRDADRCIHSRSSLMPSLRDVAIHPVPPDARPRCTWWIFEPFLECVLGSLGHANSNEEDRCQCRNRKPSPRLSHNWQISNEGGQHKGNRDSQATT